MKKIFLFILTIMIFGCSASKRIIEKDYILGQWKEIQGRATKNSPVKDAADDCLGGPNSSSMFLFKNDGSYSYNDNCSEQKYKEKGTWEYRDHILSLTTGNDNIKFSVSYAGKNKIKFSSLLINMDGDVVDNFDFGYFVILEKQ